MDEGKITVKPDEVQDAPQPTGRVSRRQCLGLLASCGVIALLAACGNTGAAAVTTESGTAATAAPTAPAPATVATSSIASATTAGKANVAASSTDTASSGSAVANAAVIKIQTTGAKLPAGPVKFHWVDSGDQKAVFFRAFFPAYHAAHPNVTVTYDPLPSSTARPTPSH